MGSLNQSVGIGEPRVVFFGYGEGDSLVSVRPAIVLVRPNEIETSAILSGSFRENLGILALAAHLQLHGVRFGVLEATLFQCTPQQTAELAIASSPVWIGISAYCTWIMDQALQLAALIKERQPSVRIVLGGHGAHFVARQILDHNPAVDAVIRSEGEDALLGLLEARDESEWARVPNLSYRRGEAVVENPLAPLDSDLDASPLPSRFGRDLIEKDPLLSQTPYMMFTSKGCYDHCAFCTVNQFYHGWRGRSPKPVVDEMEALLKRFRWRTVHFWDDQFTGPGLAGRRRAIEVGEEIKRRGLDVAFHVTIRPSDISEEMVRALAEAGMRSAFLGVESSDQATLDGFLGKHMKAEDSIRAIELLWSHGVHRIVLGFMLFHSRMTWETFRRDVDFLESLRTAQHSCLTTRTVYYPGSELWSEISALHGPDAYKEVYLPPLPSPAFNSLFSACCHFYHQCAEIEMLFFCLEERHLADLSRIDFIVSCRTRLFRFVAARVRVVADLLERGANHREAADRLGDEIFHEAMHIIDALRGRFGGPHFDHLLRANQLVGYERFLEPDTSLASTAKAP